VVTASTKDAHSPWDAETLGKPSLHKPTFSRTPTAIQIVAPSSYSAQQKGPKSEVHPERYSSVFLNYDMPPGCQEDQTAFTPSHPCKADQHSCQGVVLFAETGSHCWPGSSATTHPGRRHTHLTLGGHWHPSVGTMHQSIAILLQRWQAEILDQPLPGGWLSRQGLGLRPG